LTPPQGQGHGFDDAWQLEIDGGNGKETKSEVNDAAA
jgi:hypothetical protein